MHPLPWRLRVLLVCVAAACLFAGRGAAWGQGAVHLRGTVRDSSGRAVAGATVLIGKPGIDKQGPDGPQHEAKAVSGADGKFEVDAEWLDPASRLVIRASSRSMASDPLEIAATAVPGQIDLVMHPSAVSQQITVTATRSSMDLPATANTVYVLGARELNNFPAFALDDKLRQQAGFELFRRSPSHVQNPTSQGISLRGLGSTAVSRTLVLSESVPMNDPFGGWIHWDEIPAEAVEAVTIATGGGSDLYGSSALGGVIDVVPARPSTGGFDLNAAGGGQDTSLVGVRGDIGNARLSQLLAADSFRTAGYIPTSPALLGAVDTPANVHYQAVRSETDDIGAPGRTFLVGNMLNEARGNGTPMQTNATRLWRYLAGDDWRAGTRASGRVRAFGSDESYRQSFSSINAARSSETLTRRQRVRTEELGGSADAALSLSPVALVVGADVRDIRGTDNETPIAAGVPNGVVNTSARQRFVGGFGEALAAFGRWSGALSLRLDQASNLDTKAITLPSSIAQPVTTANRSELIASPRLGLVRQVTASVALHASVFRAFRTPTMNELYRTGQVGQETTQANAQLQSERATGWEAGARYGSPGGAVAVGGTYFWTEINRPVSAVLVSSTATTILDKRQNLGQIVSQGTELHAETRLGRHLSATAGYQYAHAVVTAFSAQPGLVGNWIPQVPRQSFTAQLRAQSTRVGEAAIAVRASGHAFDDSANTYPLDRFFTLDLAARREIGWRWTASVTMQNLLNQRPEVARTPLLTLGSPFLAQGGVAFHWSRTAAH